MYRKITKTILLIIFIMGTSFIPKLSAQTVKPGKNLALGKSYTISIPPTAKWYSLLTRLKKTLPKANIVLTDGVKSKSSSFWVSSEALNFLGVSPIDIIIDLGKVQPISAISSNHSARPGAGIVLPQKEQYFVSVKGEKFIPVAEYLNTQDPALATSENKKKFFSGIKTFSSGHIKTKGRYVLVRTYGIPGNPAQPGVVFANYIGHDEITVTAGKFSPKSVKLNYKNAIALHAPISEKLTGYPYHARPWSKLFAKTPLRFLLVPNSFNGSKTYQLSVGGIYVPCWSEIDNSIKKPKNITFKCSFPNSVEVIDWNRLLPLKKITEKNKTSYSYTIKYPSYLHRPFFFIKAKANTPAKNIGTMTFSWSYQQAGKSYQASESYTLVLNKKITAPAPKRFKTGFWCGSTLKAITHSYTTARQLFGFYKTLGFNWTSGGFSNAGTFKASHELGINGCFEKALDPNALMPAKFDKALKARITKEAPFVYANGSKRGKRYGICPTKYLSGKFDKALIALAKNKLSVCYDIYDNWEPYMFEKAGCACDDCKHAFQKRYKLSDRQVNKLWPGVVTDWNNQQHSQFFSEQLGKIMIKNQHYVEVAGRELKLNYTPSFIPSMHPNYFNPHHKWNKTHNPKDFLPGMKKIILWSYLNGNNPFSAPGDSLIGNNLAFLPSWNNAINARKKWGHKDKQGHYLPKIYFLQTEYYFAENFVTPKDYYFTSVMTFIHGLDGYGTWGQFLKQEARYLKQHARANRFISKYENMVLDGKTVNNFTVTQLEPTAPKVIYSRGFKYHNRYYIAIGNDHLKPVKITIKGNLTGKELLDDLNENIYKGNLSSGIALTIPGKSWFFLELIK